MSSKTKIVVLHLKEVIYTGIFAILGILFIALLIIMFLPGKKDGKDKQSTPDTSPKEASQEADETAYIPGIYTTALVLNNHAVDIEVVVDADNINSVRLVNLDEAITTLYPLIQPAFDALVAQIYKSQTLEDITYSDESKYTSLVLLNAIQSALDKAVAAPVTDVEE